MVGLATPSNLKNTMKNYATSPVARRKPSGVTFKPVCFQLVWPQAKSVQIAGTFNGWNPQLAPMLIGPEGCWVKMLNLPSGQHQYRFVVDGEWMADPRCSQSVPNPFGGMNSVRTIPAGPDLQSSRGTDRLAE